jgi:methylated-DNA-[protein]-cysteine S-methyltransferase
MKQVPEEILSGKVRSSMSFHEKVWAVCCTVPAGKVTTYGAIAKKVGSPQASRAVGQALNRNPYPPDVPCHRVVGGNRTLTGFAGGLPKKRQLLMSEGIAFEGERVAAGCIL